MGQLFKEGKTAFDMDAMMFSKPVGTPTGFRGVIEVFFSVYGSPVVGFREWMVA